MEQYTNKTTILHLNDDCLGEIFKYLNKCDQIIFGLSCQQFESVFKIHCKKEHSFFITNTSWCKDAFEKYFKLAGSLIKSIQIEFGAQVSDELIIKYCSKVETIIYARQCLYRSFIGKVKNLVKNLKSLHSLKLFDCTFDDHLIEAIIEIPKIDEITIQSNHLIKGNYFKRLENIKLLSLEGCFIVKSELLNDISMRDLQTLNLKDCFNVSAASLQKLTKQCTNLSTLSFTCSAVDNQKMYKELLIHLPSLKHLDVNNCTNVFLRALAENDSDQLEKLTLKYKSIEHPRGYVYKSKFDYREVITKYQNLNELSIDGCHNHITSFIPLKHLKKICLTDCSVSIDGIMHLLQNCPQLVYISVEDNRSIIKKILLSEAIQFLDTRKDRKGPVKLRLEIKDLTNDYLQTAEYCINKHILQLQLIDQDDHTYCYSYSYDLHD